MAQQVLFVLAGLVLAGLTLSDVFETVVVPGGSRASLKVAKRLLFVLLPLWKAARGRRQGLSGAFAPLILVLCFLVWMMLLAIGFGLMAYAAKSHFNPPITSFFDAVYIVGSSLVTVGLGPSNPAGIARWIMLGAGFCGLAVMTMAVTYLLEVQGSVSRRDIGVIKLNTSAGEPPSGLSLLERFAATGNRSEIVAVLREARNWCATVRQSHSNHPSLIYFQSVSTGSGWPAALGAILDLALLSEQCIEDESLKGPALLLRDEASRMASELARVIGLHPKQGDGDEPQLRQAAGRLQGSGYALRDPVDFRAMAFQRSEHQGCVRALADHLGKASSVLVREI